MEIAVVQGKELYDLMQYIHLLKVKFGNDDIWVVAPVLFATEETVDVLIDMGNACVSLSVGQQAMLKFQKANHEYLVSGEIVEMGDGCSTSVSIRYTLAQKYCNFRKNMRFDASLKVLITEKDGNPVESETRNISKGGAMVISGADLEDGGEVEIQITFASGNRFKSTAQILRKSAYGDACFSYGIQFMSTSLENTEVICAEVTRYEREFLKSLNILREYKQTSEQVIDTKIAIFSDEPDESYEIRETLVKIGAENFQVYRNFTVYTGFFAEEQPKVIIVDSLKPGREIYDMIRHIVEDYSEIYVVLLIPMDFAQMHEDMGAEFSRISVLYKPLIYDEFEKEIIKFL